MFNNNLLFKEKINWILLSSDLVWLYGESQRIKYSKLQF